MWEEFDNCGNLKWGYCYVRFWIFPFEIDQFWRGKENEVIVLLCKCIGVLHVKFKALVICCHDQGMLIPSLKVVLFYLVVWSSSAPQLLPTMLKQLQPRKYLATLWSLFEELNIYTSESIWISSASTSLTCLAKTVTSFC